VPDMTQLEWYQWRVRVLETLLAGYRHGRKPSEKLFLELTLTRGQIDYDGSWLGAAPTQDPK
jgi:hypothetical protein